MIRIRLADPERFPRRIPVIAVHRPGDITFIARADLTTDQLAHAIDSLGAHMTREAIDATLDRSTPAPE